MSAEPESVLPSVNALLNATTSLLLVAGLVAIKRGARGAHERLMSCAGLCALAFLSCYLYYHFSVLTHMRYNGSGWRRGAYLALLLSHTILAVVNAPMVVRTFWLAHRERWEQHKRLARITYPIWLYVSVTGVLVYLVLYHWNPPAPAA